MIEAEPVLPVQSLASSDKRQKTFSVGIPKIISFDITMTNPRKSGKRVPRNNTPIQYDDPSLMHTPPSYKREPIVSSGSDGDAHMNSANQATTHSDSVECIDDDDRLKALPAMLNKLVATAAAASETPNTTTTTTKTVGFVRSPQISPRRRRSSARPTPVLGSNRSRTTPSSPTTLSPRGSLVIEVPDTIEIEPEKAFATTASSTSRKAPHLTPMKSPRHSLYDSNVTRRQRNNITGVDLAAVMKKCEAMQIDVTQEEEQQRQQQPDDTVLTSRSAGQLKRSTTQLNRELDGFIKELSSDELFSCVTNNNTIEEPIHNEEPMCASFGDTYESVVFEEPQPIQQQQPPPQPKQIEQKQETKVVKPSYGTMIRGDLLPRDLVDHDAVALYEDGVVNWRYDSFELDHPSTFFCFQCDAEIKLGEFERCVCVTEYRPDLVYGILRCRVYRDVNMCHACHANYLPGTLVRLTPRAQAFYRKMYPHTS